MTSFKQKYCFGNRIIPRSRAKITARMF